MKKQKLILLVSSTRDDVSLGFYSGLIDSYSWEIGCWYQRMNKYMVGKAAQALAETLKDHGEEAIKRGVAIS